MTYLHAINYHSEAEFCLSKDHFSCQLCLSTWFDVESTRFLSLANRSPKPPLPYLHEIIQTHVFSKASFVAPILIDFTSTLSSPLPPLTLVKCLARRSKRKRMQVFDACYDSFLLRSRLSAYSFHFSLSLLLSRRDSFSIF